MTNRHEVVESRDGRVSKYPDTWYTICGITINLFPLAFGPGSTRNTKNPFNIKEKEKERKLLLQIVCVVKP